MNYFLAYLVIGLVLSLKYTLLNEKLMRELEEEGVFEDLFDPVEGLRLVVGTLTALIVGTLGWPLWMLAELRHKLKGENHE